VLGIQESGNYWSGPMARPGLASCPVDFCRHNFDHVGVAARVGNNSLVACCRVCRLLLSSAVKVEVSSYQCPGTNKVVSGTVGHMKHGATNLAIFAKLYHGISLHRCPGFSAEQKPSNAIQPPGVGRLASLLVAIMKGRVRARGRAKIPVPSLAGP
jgi:hypothetical protein